MSRAVVLGAAKVCRHRLVHRDDAQPGSEMERPGRRDPRAAARAFSSASSATTTGAPGPGTAASRPTTTSGRRVRAITCEPTDFISFAAGSGRSCEARHSTLRSSAATSRRTSTGFGSTRTSTSEGLSPARLASSWTWSYVHASSASVGAMPITCVRAPASVASAIPTGSATAANSDPSSGMTTSSNMTSPFGAEGDQ